MTSKYIIGGIPCLTLRYTLNITETNDHISSGPSITISLPTKKDIQAKAEFIAVAIDTEVKMIQIAENFWINPQAIKMMRITEEIWLPQDNLAYWNFDHGHWHMRPDIMLINEDMLDAEYTKWQLLSAENNNSDKKLLMVGAKQSAGRSLGEIIRL